jgi:hypothetical protein
MIYFTFFRNLEVCYIKWGTSSRKFEFPNKTLPDLHKNDSMTSYAVSADTTGKHHDCSSGAGEQAATEDFMVPAVVPAIKQQQRRMP